jgi:hypothetical protein
MTIPYVTDTKSVLLVVSLLGVGVPAEVYIAICSDKRDGLRHITTTATVTNKTFTKNTVWSHFGL